jgi:hypothetical protein
LVAQLTADQGAIKAFLTPPVHIFVYLNNMEVPLTPAASIIPVDVCSTPVGVSPLFWDLREDLSLAVLSLIIDNTVSKTYNSNNTHSIASRFVPSS